MEFYPIMATIALVLIFLKEKHPKDFYAMKEGFSLENVFIELFEAKVEHVQEVLKDWEATHLISCADEGRGFFVRKRNYNLNFLKQKSGLSEEDLKDIFERFLKYIEL